MNIRLIITACAVVMLLSASVVRAFESEEYPLVDTTWGQSVQEARKIQIANPNAGKVTGPIEGLDGRAAEKIMGAYCESFSKKGARRGYSLDSISVISPGGQ